MKRCGRWRACEKCARIRQAKIADKAEAMGAQFGPLHLTVITPEENSGTAIRRLRASLLRKHIAQAGIWTIEKGEQFGLLHLNILTPEPRPFNLPHAAIHTEPITAPPRAVASYIAKKSGAPSEAQYNGRLAGSWGQIGQFLATKEAAPIVVAAAINDLITTPHTRKATTYFIGQHQENEPAPTLTKEEYQALARKHLAGLYAIVERQSQKHFGT